MNLSVYFINGCRAGTTFEYRVLQKQEQLARYGVVSTIRQLDELRESTLQEIADYDLLYLYRVPYGGLVERLIERARGCGLPVIFDVDDLIFEPTIVEKVDPVRAMNLETAVLYYQGVWRYRRTILASDAVTTSTEYLAQQVAALGRPAYVHRNGLSKWMIAESERVRRERGERSGRIVIGYGSGTATHRRDFAEAASALAEVMHRHPEVELHIVGDLHPEHPLPLPEPLRSLESRIRHLPAVPWKEWLALQGRLDISLAPLERGNPYCEAKSEVKYIEAAIMGVPTVASRTDGFERAIRDGETGFLAGDTEEWIEKLERLITDPVLRHEMGEAARSDVLRRYTPDVLGEALFSILLSIREDAEREAQEAEQADAPLILNWIFPEPIPGSGGYRDIVRMINLLADFGHRINAYVVPRQLLWKRSDQEIRAFIQRHFGELQASIFKWAGGEMEEADGVVLTHWSTAYLVEGVCNASRIFYFVQDWEPFFFPMGTNYLRAEQTYKMGFSCITLGQWLTKRLREWYGADADYFDLAVDHTIYYPREVERATHPRLCFYARPSTPRRLFPIGMEALELIHQRRPDVEIILYGSEEKDLRAFDIPFPYTCRGILDEEGLAELFSTCDVGIVLSPTNCSLVPPEMMACRCAVVDLNRETVMGVMEHEVNALLAEPTPQAIAEAAIRLLDDEGLRSRLVETAYRQVQERSWTKSARKVEAILQRKLPSLRRGKKRYRFRDESPLLPLGALPEHQRVLLDALHRSRRRPLARIRASASLARQWLGGGGNLALLNETPVRLLGELRGKRRFRQYFVAWRDGLYRVDLLFSAYGRRNTRDLLFHLYEISGEQSQEIATVRLNASFVLERTYVSFLFPTQGHSEGKTYAFDVESPDSVVGDAVGLWAYSDASVPGLRLERNGHPLRGHLVFGLYYRDEEVGWMEERPILHNWGRGFGWRDRLRRAWHILSTQGIGGLWKAVVDYWRWWKSTR